MAVRENSRFPQEAGDHPLEDPEQRNESKLHFYERAAVKQQEELACLNERLARFLRLALDVGLRFHEPPSERSSGPTHEDSISQFKKSPRNGSVRRIERSPTNDSSSGSPLEIGEVEDETKGNPHHYQSSSRNLEIRIATLRRAVTALNDKNDDLMQRNAELSFSKAEADSELRKLKDDNEKLRDKMRRIGSLYQTVPHMSEPHSLRKVISSLQRENEMLRARLDRHKQIIRSGLDDFISRSSEALQNGTLMRINCEQVDVHDSDDESEITTTRTDLSVSSARRNLETRERIALLEEHLQSTSDELDHEKFRSQRKMKAMQEIVDEYRDDFTRKEDALQRTNEELETALELLRCLVHSWKDTQREIDVYRSLLGRAEPQLYDRHDDSSPVSSSASEASIRSRENSEDSDQMRPLTASEEFDEARKSTPSLEVEEQDVRKGKFVVLRNKGDESLDISRWYLVQQCRKNKVSHRFPSPFIIKPRSKVIIWSADVKAGHRSPMNYVMAKTVLPWCESGEADLITKVYDRQGYQISKRETRIRVVPPVKIAAPKVNQNSKSFVHDLESQACSVS